jgi:hypothetical protein
MSSGRTPHVVGRKRNEVSDMKACRLIYKSVATAEVVSNQTIRDLATRAAKANSESGITGLLILTGNVFVQVLEGPSKAVNQLYCNIVGDKRHRQVELVSFEAMARPCFAEWSMRLVDFYDLPKAARDFMTLKYSHKEGSVELPEEPHELFSLLLDARAVCASMSAGEAD